MCLQTLIFKIHPRTCLCIYRIFLQAGIKYKYEGLFCVVSLNMTIGCGLNMCLYRIYDDTFHTIVQLVFDGLIFKPKKYITWNWHNFTIITSRIWELYLVYFTHTNLCWVKNSEWHFPINIPPRLSLSLTHNTEIYTNAGKNFNFAEIYLRAIMIEFPMLNEF